MSAIDLAYVQRRVTRQQWGARVPTGVTRFTPGFGTTIHHEGPALGAYEHASCPSKVRGIQAYHMDAKGWADGAYTCIVCRHGAIYELRGPGVRTAANGTNEGNDRAHAVCALVGVGDALPQVLIESLAVACAWLNQPVEYGDNINGHRNWKPTVCPNDDLYARLPDIRARASYFWAGATPMAPPVAIAYPRLREDTVRQRLINVDVRDHRGYTDLLAGTHGLTESIAPYRVVGSPVYAGDNPGDGWGARNRSQIELVNVGGVARVVIPDHEVAAGTIGVYVTIADPA